MASITVPCVTIYPDTVVSILTDSVTGLPLAVTVQPGASAGIAWEITFKGVVTTGQAAAGGLLQTVTLTGATAATDLSSVTVGRLLTNAGATFGPGTVHAARAA